MDDYFDKEKFTGGGAAPGGSGQPPRRPQSRKQDNSGWYSWPVIIILFAVGVWPVALILLFYNIFGSGKKTSSSKTVSFDTQRRAAQSFHEAESAVEQAMRRAEAKVDRAASKAADKTDEALRRAAAQVERTIDRTARQVEQAGKSTRQAAPPPQARPVKDAKPAKEKKQKAKPAGVLLRIFGLIALFIGFCISADFMSELLQGYGVDFDNFFASLGFLGAGGLMFFRGRYLNKMSRRSQRYILAIGNTDAMPIEEIAKRVNRTPAQAVKEMEKLIDKGYLGEDAYIDHQRGYFLRFGATLEEEEPPVREAPAPQPTPKEAQEGYSGILRNIRHANDRIADPELSRKIERIEQVTGLIFREVEEHPEKRERIRTFFDYYLPTTQKLLDAYADFEETGVEGENLRSAKQRIEQTMDSIVDGFAHQLDQLYRADAMDVATDIKVMESMLHRDTSSAARDFGYDQQGQA